MSDQSTAVDHDEQIDDVKDDRPEENIRAELDRRREAEKKAKQEADELRDRLMQLEDRDKSETERERAARVRAEDKLQELMGQVTALEKGAWVRNAAAEMNFHNPEDAFEMLKSGLGDLEDAREAKRAVQRLASTRKHLIRDEKKSDSGSPLSRVFAGDRAAQQDDGKGGRRQVTPQQQAAARELEFAEGLAKGLARFRDGWHETGGIA